MPRRPDGLNAVGAIQGGLAAVALEEAVTSLAPTPATSSSLVVRYLRPVMQGPAVAVAVAAGEVHTVRLDRRRHREAVPRRHRPARLPLIETSRSLR